MKEFDFDEDSNQVFDFTNKTLEGEESALKEMFENSVEAEIFMHMNLIDALAFRLLCGGWKKEALKEWMGEGVDRAHEDLIEIENESATKDQLAKPTAQRKPIDKNMAEKIFKEWLDRTEIDGDGTLQ